MKKIIIPLFALLLAGGCGRRDGAPALYYSDGESYAESYDQATMAAGEVTMADRVEVAEQPSSVKKKIIRTGRMGVQVGELQCAKRQVDTLVSAWGGYYAGENYSSAGDRPEYTLSIRVPSERYDAFLAAVEGGAGKVLYKEVSAMDITEDWLDTETRLANRQSYLERYRDLLRRAGTIKEILEVEEQIRQLEEEIESAEGRLRYMNDRVAYSSLDLTLTTVYKYVPSNEDSFPQRMLRALGVGWRGLVEFFLVMVYLWPLWVIAAAAIVTWRYFRKKRRRR